MLFNVHIVSEEEYTNYLKTLVAKGQIGEARGPKNAEPGNELKNSNPRRWVSGDDSGTDRDRRRDRSAQA